MAAEHKQFLQGGEHNSFEYINEIWCNSEQVTRVIGQIENQQKFVCN